MSFELAEKMARLYPGKAWRVVYDDQGGERIEWNEPGPAPKIDAVQATPLPPPGPGLEQRVSALEARLAALEKGRP